MAVVHDDIEACKKEAAEASNDAPPTKTREQITTEAALIFDTLINEGIQIPGDHGVPHKDLTTDYPNSTELIQEGKEFFHRHYFSCAWAIILTELVQYPITRITGFVLRNEYYNGTKFAYLRGVVTFIHIMKWFGGDIANKAAESSQDVLKVRKMHQDALEKLRDVPSPPANMPKKEKLYLLEAIRQDLATVKDPPYLPLIMTSSPESMAGSVAMSQFDMVMVHGVFFFLLDVNPRICGLHNMKNYESYIYYLGLIGRYLGIQDRFNLPLIKDPEVRREVSRRFWEEIITPAFKNFQEKEFHNLCFFAEHGFILNPFEIAMHILVKDILGVGPAANTKKYVNCFYRFIYFFVPLGIYLLKFRPFQILANLIMRFWLWIGITSTKSLRRNVENSKAKNGKNSSSKYTTTTTDTSAPAATIVVNHSKCMA